MRDLLSVQLRRSSSSCSTLTKSGKATDRGTPPNTTTIVETVAAAA